MYNDYNYQIQKHNYEKDNEKLNEDIKRYEDNINKLENKIEKYSSQLSEKDNVILELKGKVQEITFLHNDIKKTSEVLLFYFQKEYNDISQEYLFYKNNKEKELIEMKNKYNEEIKKLNKQIEVGSDSIQRTSI